ncbi:hypothetical protein MPTK1_7g12830 [Marchantia polymorpha subsp. ruderalis]|uniref:Uncharacterized protein n=2 Tax=Marchantia polymorpha TaxID=3197 RepID=A0AAF6BYY2_MARPO|nr:hypothetical protein MARPO_0003s0291 [Marchantia polymorpha]BBN17216.1 hypothetical protein Mp_7g12830 [Marchantia polymorpha subsp. ruderalis]|eukprot:PTQ49451.1 hypothetical protein MARPO_0003s0291 [Marchantia polymorpha]
MALDNISPLILMLKQSLFSVVLGVAVWKLQSEIGTFLDIPRVSISYLNQALPNDDLLGTVFSSKITARRPRESRLQVED